MASFSGFVVTFIAKFVDVPTVATIVGNNAKVPVQPASAVASGNDADTNTGLTSSAPPALGVQRAAHLVENSVFKPNVNAPATYADKTDINLDEHVPGNACGVNDCVSVTSATYNSGVNYALNVSVTVPLPAYYELFTSSQVPATCVITGVPAPIFPYTTGAAGGSLTCTPPAFSGTTPPTPLGVLSYASASSPCQASSTTTTAQYFYATLGNGKFADAPTVATIVGSSATGFVPASATTTIATASGTFTHAGTAAPRRRRQPSMCSVPRTWSSRRRIPASAPRPRPSPTPPT